MHPIILITYAINLIILNSVFGIVGLFAGILGSSGVYYFISRRQGPKIQHIAQIAALAFGHLAGFIAIVNAPWGNPWTTGAAIIMELFIVAIFSGMRR